jgi:hypothetical protein
VLVVPESTTVVVPSSAVRHRSSCRGASQRPGFDSWAAPFRVVVAALPDDAAVARQTVKKTARNLRGRDETVDARCMEIISDLVPKVQRQVRIGKMAGTDCISLMCGELPSGGLCSTLREPPVDREGEDAYNGCLTPVGDRMSAEATT